MTLKLSEFLQYLPLAAGIAVVSGAIAIGRRRWRAAAIAVPASFVAVTLLGPYLQRLVIHVVEREGGGAAGLAALSVFITAAIAYVVFLGQQYEISRGKTEQSLRQLSERSEAIEVREAAAVEREARLSEQVQLLEVTTDALEKRVRHETLRAVALSAIDNVLLDPRAPIGRTQRGRVLLGLLRSIVGRTAVSSAAFDSVEIVVSLNECAARGVMLDPAIVRSVSRYLESLRELVTEDDTAGPIDDVLERLSSGLQLADAMPA